MKYSCQNLTKSIKTISQLKPGLDLVLDQEKPNIKKGLESQTRIIEIVKQYTLIVQLGVKTYNYLVKKIGSHEELEKRVSSLKIGGNTAKQLQGKLKEVDQHGKAKFHINSHTQEILDKTYRSEEFQKYSQNPENIQIIRLSVSELGFRYNPNVDQIYAIARQLGLELCPAIVGPYQRLKDVSQQANSRYEIAMVPTSDKSIFSNIFSLEHDRFGLWLNYGWADADSKWGMNNQFVFRLRGSNQFHK